MPQINLLLAAELVVVLLPLGEVALELAVSGCHPHADGEQPEVLVPNQAVAQGLQRALLQRGFSLKTAGNTCQTPAQWLARLQQAGLAMPFPQVAPADWWQPLTRLPLPEPIPDPLWLVLPQSWRRQVVLAHTAERLACSRAQKYASDVNVRHSYGLSTPHLTCVIGWWLPGDGGARQVGKDGIDAALTILWSR